MLVGISLTVEQRSTFDDLQGRSNEIERVMLSEVDQSNPVLIEEAIIKRLGYLGQMPDMVARAKLLLDWGKDHLTTELLLNDKLYNAKQAIIYKWYEGRLGELDALYTKIDAQFKGLRVQIMGLQSCLSMEREQAKIDSFSSKFST